MKPTTMVLLFVTLVAFAANSILCRQALMAGSIGPVEFTMIRLGSGALALMPIIIFRSRLTPILKNGRAAGEDLLKLSWSNFRPALALFGYAIFFSLAYVRLNASTGALILFPAVQMTMIGGSIIQGNRVAAIEWAGFAISLSGLVYLLLPGLTAPSPLGTIMMMFSGVSWGVYTLLGTRRPQPILTTARNFLFCFPGLLILGLIAMAQNGRQSYTGPSGQGVLLAVISGAAASGMGYVLWYLTVRRITTTQASISQLLVPIMAALGGVIFLDETLHLRLALASIMIVGGVVVAIAGRKGPEHVIGKARSLSR